MAFPNNYAHRRVADTNARACEICFKPSTSVLVTSENKDFFYVCPSHLKDTSFCTPIIDQAAAEAARRKKELDAEVARVKAEYEEKQRKKKEKDKKGKAEGNKSKDDGEENGEDKQDKPEDTKSPAPDEPRMFELKRPFYAQRLEKKRAAEMAKRNRERLQNPNFFPSVPKGLP